MAKRFCKKKSIPVDVKKNVMETVVQVSLTELDNRSSRTGKSFSEALLFAEHGENILCTEIVSDIQNNFCTHALPMFYKKKSF